MSINKNIDNLLNSSFENFNYLPQKIMIEDHDLSILDFIEKMNLTVINNVGINKTVPVIPLAQELWAERKINWMDMTNESGEEIGRPFMTIMRNSIKQGTSPLKRSVPNRMKFNFLKIPNFDGTLKGYDVYKIPQPTLIDIEYTLSLYSHYMIDTNLFYEKILMEGFSGLQGYMNINGYHVSSRIGDPSENNKTDITEERVYRIDIPITVYGKLVDPTTFQKINTTTKVLIKISEKNRFSK